MAEVGRVRRQSSIHSMIVFKTAEQTCRILRTGSPISHQNVLQFTFQRPDPPSSKIEKTEYSSLRVVTEAPASLTHHPIFIRRPQYVPIIGTPFTVYQGTRKDQRGAWFELGICPSEIRRYACVCCVCARVQCVCTCVRCRCARCECMGDLWALGGCAVCLFVRCVVRVRCVCMSARCPFVIDVCVRAVCARLCALCVGCVFAFFSFCFIWPYFVYAVRASVALFDPVAWLTWGNRVVCFGVIPFCGFWLAILRFYGWSIYCTISIHVCRVATLRIWLGGCTKSGHAAVFSRRSAPLVGVGRRRSHQPSSAITVNPKTACPFLMFPSLFLPFPPASRSDANTDPIFSQSTLQRKPDSRNPICRPE